MSKSIQIPFFTRLAPKTAGVVTIVAIALAIVFSTMQIYQDYQVQKKELESKVLQVVNIMKQTAIQSAYLVDSPLALTVAKGLFEYQPIVEVQILDDFNKTLGKMKRPRVEGQIKKVSEILFGQQKKYEIPLVVNIPKPTNIGKLIVYVDPYSVTEAFIHRALLNIVYGLVRNIILSLFIYLFFYFIVTRPLLSLIRSFTEFNSKEPGTMKLSIPKAHKNDELGLLVTISNNLFRAIGENAREIKKSAEEKRELEKKLQHSHKIEAIGTLAGGIAHDFNNILSVILGYTDMAKADAPPGSKYAEDLERVLDASHRAKDLVKQILAFSRQTEIERIPMQLQSVIKETLKMLRSSLPTTIEIVDDIDSSCGIVLTDPTQIHQILMNLCGNAYHSMEESGGTLKIELKSVCLDKGKRQLALNIEPGEYVELIVSDTGSGIGPDVIDKIYDPYFTTKEFGKGTGMGLSIIYGILANYGGAITAESELDKGTSFHVYFPVVEQEPLLRVKDAEEISLGKERILFIDDEAILAQMGKDMLERLGYSVTTRQSSLDALATFQDCPDDFDVIITDQTMPGMTGADLARRMLEIRPDIPIILCTGYSNLIDEKSAKYLGIQEFVMKPLTISSIAKLLRKVLDAS